MGPRQNCFVEAGKMGIDLLQSPLIQALSGEKIF
jgi:hypothetical protein